MFLHKPQHGCVRFFHGETNDLRTVRPLLVIDAFDRRYVQTRVAAPGCKEVQNDDLSAHGGQTEAVTVERLHLLFRSRLLRELADSSGSVIAGRANHERKRAHEYPK